MTVAILQPGTGRILGDHYLRATPHTVTWGRLPCGEDAPVLEIAPGDTVTVDTVSHEGILEDQGRDPAEFFGRHVVVDVLDDAIALALHMTSGTREVLHCLLEGLRWLWGAEAVRVAGRSGISQARARMGEAPPRRLHERAARPVATRATKGAWCRAWRLVSLDGPCLDVADAALPSPSGRAPSSSPPDDRSRLRLSGGENPTGARRRAAARRLGAPAVPLLHRGHHPPLRAATESRPPRHSGCSKRAPAVRSGLRLFGGASRVPVAVTGGDW